MGTLVDQMSHKILVNGKLEQRKFEGVDDDEWDDDSDD